ncbi:hypothetical protein ISCGN_001147 [Ixodes scapularis]
MTYVEHGTVWTSSGGNRGTTFLDAVNTPVGQSETRNRVLSLAASARAAVTPFRRDSHRSKIAGPLMETAVEVPGLHVDVSSKRAVVFQRSTCRSASTDSKARTLETSQQQLQGTLSAHIGVVLDFHHKPGAPERRE